MSILGDLFRQKASPLPPIKDCRNCTYYRPNPNFYGFCNKLNENLVSNQAPLCSFYLPFGQIQTQIDAGFVISGVFDLDRIPRLTLAKLPLGSNGYFLKGKGSTDDPLYALLVANDIPSLDASKIASGVFDLARVPNMDDAHIPNVETLSYGGAFADGQIPILQISKISGLQASLDSKALLSDFQRLVNSLDVRFATASPSWKLQQYIAGVWTDIQLSVSALQDLPASKTTSGIFDVARIPDLSANKIVSDVLALARIPNMDWAHISGLFPRTVADVLSNSVFTSVVQATGYKNTSPSVNGLGAISWDTWYQNTSGKTKMVYVTCSGESTTDIVELRISPDQETVYVVCAFTTEPSSYRTLMAIVHDTWYWRVHRVGTTANISGGCDQLL